MLFDQYLTLVMLYYLLEQGTGLSIQLELELLDAFTTLPTSSQARDEFGMKERTLMLDNIL